MRGLPRIAGILCVAATLAGCGQSASTPQSVAPPSAADSTCTGTVAEYCRLAGCPTTYAEALTLRRGLCSRPGIAIVRAETCAGVFRSVTWRDHLIGGGDEYFDESGRLTAAYLVSDYGSQYCGRSFSQTFGTVPACPGAVVTTSLCE